MKSIDWVWVADVVLWFFAGRMSGYRKGRADVLKELGWKPVPKDGVILIDLEQKEATHD